MKKGKRMTGISEKGIVANLFEKLIEPAKPVRKSKIALVGIGLEEHFDWQSIIKSYNQAKESLEHALPGEFVDLVKTEQPIQTKEDILDWLDKTYLSGMDALVIYQASYIAGDLAATLARWLYQHKMPVLSWSHAEATGGRLSNNRLCGQNFLLNILKSTGVPFSWIFEAPDSPNLSNSLKAFVHASYAKASINQRNIAMIGGFRVPGFYDCELNEMALLKRYGIKVDRIDFESIWKHAQKFEAKDIEAIKKAILEHPNCKFNNVPDDQLFKSIQLALAITDFSRFHNYLGVALKNWPELFDHYGIAGDGAGALIQDMGIPVADESDMGALITMVILNQLSMYKAVPTLVDMSLIDTNTNKIGYWHCGGASTRLMKKNTGFEVRKHSILENYSEDSSMGMLLEFLQAPGEVSIAKYMYPDAAEVLCYEGEIIESEMAFRGSYAEVRPKIHQAADIVTTVLNNGCDHHWIIARGNWLSCLQEFNHWLDVAELPFDKANALLSGRSK